MLKERQFRVFSIAILALVSLVCMQEKRAGEENLKAEEAIAATAVEFDQDAEIKAVNEIQDINAKGYTAYVIGEAQPIGR